MADNFITNAGSGGDTFAADEIAAIKHQRVKIQHGADGSATDVSSASPLPVTGPLTDTELRATAVPVSGTVTASGPLTDAQLRATAVPVSGTVTASGPLTDTQLRATAVPVSGTVTASGPLTDTQLRATAVPVSGTVAVTGVATETTLSALNTKVATAKTADFDTGAGTDTVQMLGLALPKSGGAVAGGTSTDPVRIDPTGTTPQPISGTVTATGPLTDTQLRATAVPVSGPLTDTQLRATPVPVSGTVTASGPLTDTQLRATPVPVSGTVTASGPLTDTQLRATAVPISGTVSVSGTVTVDQTNTATADYDTGAGTVNQEMVGIAVPASGGPVAGGTATAPLRTDPTGTTTQPVSAASLPLPTGAATSALQTSGDQLVQVYDSASGFLLAIDGTGRATVNAVQGTATNLKAQVVGPTADNSANPTAKLSTLPAVANAAAPTRTEGNVVPLRTNLAGDVAITLDGEVPAVTVNSGTITATQGTGTNLHVVVDSGSITVSGGGGDGAILDGVSAAIKASVLDYTNSNPLAVRLTDTSGDYVGAGAGTQYTEDVASAADPVGSQLMARRRDSLATETTTDGDNTAVNSTGKGELYVKHVDAIPVTDNGGALTVDGTVAVSSVGGTVTVSGAVTNTVLSVVGGGAEATAQRVTIANDSTGVISVDDNGGALTVDGTISVSGTVTVDSELTTADLDTGAGTDTRAVVGIVGSKSGGAQLIPGDATAGLKVDLGADNDVTITSGTVTTVSTVTNLSQMSGTAISMNTGVRDAGTQRITVATNDVVPVSGTVTANAGTGTLAVSLASLPTLVAGTANIGDVDVLTLPALVAGTANIGDVDVLTLPALVAGSALIGKVGIDQTTPGTTNAVSPVVAANGGSTPYQLISAATTNATSVKASAAKLSGYYLSNINAAARYVKFYDKASAPTVGTDTPKLTLMIPAGSAANLDSACGIDFPTGLAFAITTGVAVADTGAVAANEIVVDLWYK